MNKNKSLKRSNEKKTNNYYKNNIGYLTQRELSHYKLKEKINFNNNINSKNKNNIKKYTDKMYKQIKQNNSLNNNKCINKLNDKIKNYEINIKQLEIENKKLKYNIQQLEILQDKILSKSKSAHHIIKKNDINDNKNNKRPFTSFKLNKKLNKNTILKKSFEKAQSSIELQNLLPKSFITSQVSPEKNYNSNQNDNFLTPKEKMRFKTLYFSKNNDKLYKPHGYQNLITQLNEFRELIEHTNRLFLYKDRIKNKSKLFLEQNKSNQRNIFII